MPYIGSEIRESIEPHLTYLLEYLGTAKLYGVLNYVITQILLNTQPQCYEDYQALIGVLECAKLELYRRVVAGYEDKKRKENGDVYL
jgi:hypothetical protein